MAKKSPNKLALITGGARMGESIAKTLAQKGFDVVFTYWKSRIDVEKAQKTVLSLGRKSTIIKADLTRFSDVQNLIKKIRKNFSRLDALINMCSVYDQTPFSKLDQTVWEKNIDANLKSAFFLVQAATSLLKIAKGRVIHFSDWVAASGRPRYLGFLPYYVSKKGILGLTEAQALELAPDVLVNCIAPGPILAPKTISNEETRAISKTTPLKKWGGPEEIAKAVNFLIDTNFVTGECIRVDGGRHLL